MARNFTPTAVSATIAASLAHHRTAAGMTCASLARATERVGHRVDDRYIALIERHEKGCGIDDLLSLAAALGICPAELLLSPDAGRDDPVRVAEHGRAYSAEEVWDWLTARSTLGASDGAPLAIDDLADLSDEDIVATVRRAAAAARTPAPPWGA